MKPFFKELFDYSHHYNQQLSETFMESPDKTSDKAVALYNHLLNAHQIWNYRIEPKGTAFGVWEIHAVQDLKSIDRANYERTLQILDKFDLEETIHYSNSKGKVFRNSIRDVLFHIINHSTYHRGQIATAFKAHGLAPLVTDFIFFKR